LPGHENLKIAIIKMVKVETLRAYLFGTWDRKFTFLSACLSVFSIGLTVFLWKFPEKIPYLIVIRDVIILFGLFAICGVLFGKYIRKEQVLTELVENLRTSNLNLSKLAKNFHAVNHKFRDELFSHFYTYAKTHSDLTQDDRKRFEKICHSVTTEVKNTFVEYFKANQIDILDDIVITVKLTINSACILNLYGQNFNEEQKRKITEKEQWVLTAFRDPGAYEKHKGVREVGIKLYDIDENTAFIHIFRLKKNVFVCDNLTKLGDAYANENKNWRDFYNSTAVAPIRYYDKDSGRFMYFGLIAVDSKNENENKLYENDETRHILGHAADLLANYFLSLSIASMPEQPEVAMLGQPEVALLTEN